MEKWALEEAQLSIKLVQSAEYPCYLTFLYYIWQATALHGLFSLETAALIVLYVGAWLCHQILRAIPKTPVRFWVLFALYELGQMSMLYRFLFDGQESLTSNLICSTSMLMIGEISPVHSLPLNAVLVAKHIVLWTLVAWSKGVPGEALSGVLALWCMWLLLSAQEHKRKLLIATQKAEEAKGVEEQRLKALLSAMPDGVIVISASMHILTYNPAALQQLHLEAMSNPEPSLESLLHQLNYDSEYLNSEEWEHSFEADLRVLVKGEVGRTQSFKPVLLQGRHLECRGCVAEWDESKVLVLIVRDTSNWAQLEKAAKRDSANKTALIRSVSHELRTPVNAIINLCQDLQTSTSIGERDRADVEVLANASTFLLSMINDLLDYSRILHDKFDLVRTNCDLEHLIRSCGQLIALQCRHKQVELVVRFDPLLPKLAYTDENRLKQVILNLLSNAAK